MRLCAKERGGGAPGPALPSAGCQKLHVIGPNCDLLILTALTALAGLGQCAEAPKALAGLGQCAEGARGSTCAT